MLLWRRKLKINEILTLERCFRCVSNQILKEFTPMFDFALFVCIIKFRFLFRYDSGRFGALNVVSELCNRKSAKFDWLSQLA